MPVRFRRFDPGASATLSLMFLLAGGAALRESGDPLMRSLTLALA